MEPFKGCEQKSEDGTLVCMGAIVIVLLVLIFIYLPSKTEPDLERSISRRIIEHDSQWRHERETQRLRMQLLECQYSSSLPKRK